MKENFFILLQTTIQGLDKANASEVTCQTTTVHDDAADIYHNFYLTI